MESFSPTLLAPILVGALLNLDKQVFGPFMVSRPLVTGAVIGLLCGEFQYGVWMGLAVELLWLAAMPLGGQLTPNAGLAVSAALIAWVGSGFGPAMGAFQTEAGLVVSFLTVPLWAWAFTAIDRATRKLSPRQLELARADLAAGRDPQFFQRNLVGLWLTLGFSLAGIALAVAGNTVILLLVARLAPEILLLNLKFLFLFIQFLGLLSMAVFLESKIFTYYVGGLLASLLALSAVT